MTEFKYIFVHTNQVYLVDDLDTLPDYLRRALTNCYDRVYDLDKIPAETIRSIVIHDTGIVVSNHQIGNEMIVNFSFDGGEVSFGQYYDIPNIRVVSDYIKMTKSYKFGIGRYVIRDLHWPSCILPKGFFGRDFLISHDRDKFSMTLSTDNKSDYLELMLML